MNKANLLLWLFFVLGQLLYILKRAYFSVQGPDHDVNSYAEFVRKYWASLLFRAASGAALFWVFAFYPDLFTKLVGYVGLNINLTLPTVPPVAFFLGLTSDVALDLISSKVPWLQGQIPPAGK
jgi:hypothetical protein